MASNQDYTNRFESYDNATLPTASSHANFLGLDKDINADGPFDSSPILLTEADIMAVRFSGCQRGHPGLDVPRG
jgi:hypothetical protein